MGFLFASPSDVTLIIIEESENDDHQTKTALFHVDRSKLIESSDYFQRMFSCRWEKSGNHKPTLRGDTIKGMEVIFGSIHGVEIEPEFVTVADVWYTIKACNKYLLDPKKLMGWFARWIKHIDEKQPEIWEDYDFNRQLLLPCHFFDHAEAFQHITRRLVYNAPGHITEMAPTDSPSFEPMHMPAIVIQQLNAARGRLRTVLQRSLFGDLNMTLDKAHCGCAAESMFAYFRELHHIRVKPLDSDIYKNCVSDILNRLANFNEDNMAKRKPSVQRCVVCPFSWKRTVEYARRLVDGYFHGLCLDCMQKHPDEDSEYWDLRTTRLVYDQTCRITHGEATWFSSFMGHRNKWLYRIRS
ncbi:hypothetical protein CBS147332_4633 [Penicillium roqueforti]|nr:hypothetical protein CBS147332_4633 [Penicillium roqueforti]KAI3119425.1 hypothetical protein CBS147331_2837 [Penicillium roqueforti]